jgi:RNA polymerase sigma factor (sigma-70 family)
VQNRQVSNRIGLIMNYSFEDKLDEINELLVRNRVKWQLDALSWMDYDDVCQIIRTHIYTKWSLWDQSRAFKPWCSSVISNQIFNLVRNNYANFAKPCLKCEFNTGAESCSRTKSLKQDSSCKLYLKWEKSKKNAYDIKIPVSINDSEIINTLKEVSCFNYEEKIEEIHSKILSQLSNTRHREIYRMLYIEGLEEETVAKKMNFKKDTTSERKSNRYKQITNLKKKFYELAKQVIIENDILP